VDSIDSHRPIPSDLSDVWMMWRWKVIWFSKGSTYVLVQDGLEAG
jgi:hypothetical protein